MHLRICFCFLLVFCAYVHGLYTRAYACMCASCHQLSSTLNLIPFTLHRTHGHTHACVPVATYVPYTIYPEPKTLDSEPRNADSFV